MKKFIHSKLKVYVLFVFWSLHHDLAEAFPPEVEEGLEIISRNKRETLPNMMRAPPSPKFEDQTQRFCLNRLRNALHIVCTSGTDKFPNYFNPNSSIQIASQRKSRQLKNDIPIMGQPQQSRSVLRRRSRRNIVRECCERPCSYSHIRKYCSPSIRYSPIKNPAAVNEVIKSQNLLGKSFADDPLSVGIGRGVGESAKCLGSQKNCMRLTDINNDNNHITDFEYEEDEDVGTIPNSIQCIPVSELNKYIRDFYMAKKTKNDPLEIVEHEERTEGPGPTVTTPTTNTRTTPSINPNLSNKRINEQFNFVPQTSSPEELTSTKSTMPLDSREENEIGEGTDSFGNKRFERVSSAVTVKPIPWIINFPRGTNDYIYESVDY